MPSVPEAGNSYDFYEFGGCDEFAIFPGGLIEGFDDPTPIKLQRGDMSWGARHIATKHSAWLTKNKLEVHELVWRKLREPGNIYSTEDASKLKLSLRISPTSLLVLRYFEAKRFFTVVSAYVHPSQLDGLHLGRWPGRSEAAPMPAFCLPAVPIRATGVPVVNVKRRRLYTPPT